jgi:probable HAF family extracellular repeat protein
VISLRVGLLSIACWAVGCQAALAQAMFNVVDVSPPNSLVTTGVGINNSHQVVGLYFGSSGAGLAGTSFRWDPAGGVSYLTYPGPYAVSVVGINDRGQFVARYGGDNVYRSAPNATVITAAQNLGTLPPAPPNPFIYAVSGPFSSAVPAGINVSGQITGTSQASVYTYSPSPYPPTLNVYHQRAFRTTANGRLDDPGTDLGTLVASDTAVSYGYGINASGQVVGVSTDSTGKLTAFRTSATGRVSDPGTNLGGGPGSVAYAINDQGQVTGGAGIPGGGGHAFRTTATGLISDPGADLGTLGGLNSTGVGINSLGIVIGRADSASATNRPFLFDVQMWDLNDLIAPTPGLVLTKVTAISDDNWIVGEGTINGVRHALVLVPTPEFAARVALMPVPEPGTLSLLGLIAVSGWAIRRRTRSPRVSATAP